MNIKQLEYFVEVAKTLNYTKASQHLYISQSAITKQILLLEEELGVELFMRNNKSVKLTTAGEIFLKDAISILYKIESCQNKMRDFQGDKIGQLSIGYVNGLERTVMLPIIDQFYRENPHCSMTYDSDISYILSKKMLNGEIDLILTHRYLDNPLYNNIEIFHSPFMVYVAKDSRYLNKDYFQKKDLETLNFVCDMFSHDNIPSMMIDHSLLQVLGHRGVAVLPQFAVEYTQFQNYLKGIPILDMQETIYAIYRKDNYNPFIHKFIDLFLNLK